VMTYCLIDKRLVDKEWDGNSDKVLAFWVNPRSQTFQSLHCSTRIDEVNTANFRFSSRFIATRARAQS
jgi:hypothetical protein